MGEVCDSLVFALFSLPGFQLSWFWVWSFWIISFGLNHLGTPWFSPKSFFSSSNHHFTSGSSQNIGWNIFLKWKIFILPSKTLVIPLRSQATLIFLAPKILRKILIILRTLGHLSEQKYFTTLWNIWLQKIKSFLDRNGSFYSNYLFTSSIVAGFSCAYLP